MRQALVMVALVSGLASCGKESQDMRSRLSPGTECILVPLDDQDDGHEAVIFPAEGSDGESLEGVPIGTKAVVVRDDEIEADPADREQATRMVRISVDHSGFQGTGDVMRRQLRPVK